MNKKIINPQKSPKDNCERLISLSYYPDGLEGFSVLMGYFSTLERAERYLAHCKTWNFKDLMKELDLTASKALTVKFKINNHKVKPNKPKLLGLTDDDLLTETFPARDAILELRK